MSSEATIQTVIETIDSAISARFQLSQLLDGVSEAKNQVVFLWTLQAWKLTAALLQKFPPGSV